MRGRMRFPIRIKILFVLLFMVTMVVSLITVTTARMFHADKKTYLNDLTTIVALSTAEECRALLTGYSEQLRVYARVLNRHDLSPAEKSGLLQGFFQDFKELVSVAVYKESEEISSVYDTEALEEAGLAKEQLRNFSLAQVLPPGFSSSSAALVKNSVLSETLPTLTIFQALEMDGESHVMSAFIRLDGLLRLAGRSRLFALSLLDADGVFLAHPSTRAVVERATSGLRSHAANLEGPYGSAMTVEYQEQGRDMVGGFADVDFGGVLAIAQIPATAAHVASRDFTRSLLVTALVLLLVVALLGLFGSGRLTRPMERLCDATRDIARGQFETRIAVGSRDEIGTLATSFNQMASGLKERDDALLQAQAQLVQSEKMAAFGQFGAGIAHEVKNPLAGILGCAQLSLRKVDKDSPVYGNLVLIEKETKRCRNIIDNLLRFSRQEKAVFEPVQVNHIVNDAVEIVSHQLEIKQVKLNTDLAPNLPDISASANQIQQVLMNLIMNAQQAMDGRSGNVTVSTRQVDEDHLEIRVRDDGPGMPPEIRAKIFEPFFTTKPGGKGTGLGLSVSFGIIRDHGGEIDVDSAPGQGASFAIKLALIKEYAAIAPTPPAGSDSPGGPAAPACR